MSGRTKEGEREGGRDVTEPRKGRGRLGGGAPNGLGPAASSPCQPQWNQEALREAGKRKTGSGGFEFQRVTHIQTARTDKTKGT